jgi:DMSO/TMAO reductase YedYZ molybdopterin-dependent catalytic subunit
LRLIAPGWYGIANVKWLKRIEVLDTGTWAASWPGITSPFARSNVALEKVWTEKSVGRTLLKSVPGKVTRLDGKYRVAGAHGERRSNASKCR